MAVGTHRRDREAERPGGWMTQIRPDKEVTEPCSHIEMAETPRPSAQAIPQHL